MSLTVERRVGGGAVWALFGRALGVLANLLIVVLLPRFVSPAEYGAFSLLTSLMLIFGILGMLGLNDGNVRFLAEAAARHESSRLRFILRTGLKMTVVASILFGAVAGLGVAFSGHAMLALASPWLIGTTVAVGVVLLALQVVAAESLRGLHNLRAASFLSGGGTGGPIVTMLFIAATATAYGFGFNSLAVLQTLYVGSLAVVLPFTFWILKRTSVEAIANLPPQDASPPPDVASLLQTSLPLLGAHLLVTLTMNADLWLVNQFCSLEEVGLYGAARRLTLAVAIPGQIAAQAVMSSIPDLAARGKLPELESLLRRSAFVAAVIAAVASIPLILFPDVILTMISGPAYASAAPVLVILALGNVAIAVCGNPNHALTMTGRHYAGLVVYACAAAVLTLGGIYAGRTYGTLGIAVVTACTLAAQSAASWWLARKLVGVWTHPGWPAKSPVNELRPIPQSQEVPCGAPTP